MDFYGGKRELEWDKVKRRGKGEICEISEKFEFDIFNCKSVLFRKPIYNL